MVGICGGSLPALYLAGEPETFPLLLLGIGLTVCGSGAIVAVERALRAILALVFRRDA